MAELFLSSSFVVEAVLPLILVFTLIFAILEKTRLFGDDKRQVNAMISFVIALILIATPYSRYLVVSLMPFLAVMATIFFIFMLLYGFISGGEKDILSDTWKKILIITMTVALVIFLLVISGWWDSIYGYLVYGRFGGEILVNGVLILILIAAVVAVLYGGKGKDKSD